MPSSTSSSDREIPAGRWGLPWLVALGVALALAGAAELALRRRGYQPSIKDDPYAWAWERTRASDRSPRTVAVLGTSRMNVAFAPDAFARTLPGWRSVMLAVDGTQPIGALRDLAGDPDFRGVALVDAGEDAFPRSAWDRQDLEVSAYARRLRAPGAMAERWLATAVQSRVALLSVNSVRTIDLWIRDGAFPSQPLVTRADRTQLAVFSAEDDARHRRRMLARLGAPPTPTPADADAWLADALALEADVAKIQARGGQVIYVRMPTCDERWAFDEHARPRALFWDRFAAKTRAIALHFRDDEQLARFPCSDTSHIVSRDAPAFTAALIAALQRRGVFQ